MFVWCETWDAWHMLSHLLNDDNICFQNFISPPYRAVIYSSFFTFFFLLILFSPSLQASRRLNVKESPKNKKKILEIYIHNKYWVWEVEVWFKLQSEWCSLNRSKYNYVISCTYLLFDNMNKFGSSDQKIIIIIIFEFAPT